MQHRACQWGLVKTVSNACCSGLADDTEHVETGASIIGGLTLRIIEVCRHSHNGVIDLGAQVRLTVASAVSFILTMTMEEISSGVKDLI